MISNKEVRLSEFTNSVVELKAYTEDYGESYGTGIFINEDTVITNAHVVIAENGDQTSPFDEILIRFSSSENYQKVNIVKYDLDFDVAVLRTEKDCENKIKPVLLGDSSKIKAGNTVYCVGNASNYGLSIKKGIVSMNVVNVEYKGYTKKVIQSDITIAQGDSGGALLDKYCRLIGMVSFRLKDYSSNVIYGLAYSIPINDIVSYIESD